MCIYTSSLKWTDHCLHIAKRASNTLSCIRHAMFTCTLVLILLPFNVWYNLSLSMLARFETLTWLKAFICLRLFKSTLLGWYMLNGTVKPNPGLKLLDLFARTSLAKPCWYNSCIASLFDLIHLRYNIYVVLFNSYCSFKTITYLRSYSLSFKTIDSSISAYWYSYFVNILFWGTVCPLVLWYCLLPVNFNNL